jgi:hypothetical protein
LFFVSFLLECISREMALVWPERRSLHVQV